MKDISKDKYLTGFVVLAIGLITLAVMMISNDKRHDNTTTSMGEMGSNKPQQSSKNAVETNLVSYEDFRVMPQTIRVKKGTTVTWVNRDTAKHDVTPERESEEFEASELFGKSEMHSVTFDTVGIYNYYCSPHPYMKGTVEVVE